MVRLQPCNVDDAHVDVEFVPQLETNWEALATTIKVGHHFVVVAEEGNNEGSDFWIFICEKPLHDVEEEMKKDSWGKVVFQGRQIVIGKYYKQQGKSPLSYILYENGSTMKYSSTLSLLQSSPWRLHLIIKKWQMWKIRGEFFIFSQIYLSCHLSQLSTLCFSLC